MSSASRNVLRMAEASPWIAIVDDDPSVLNALKRALRGRAFETAAYDSAQKFLAALPEKKPDCLIADLQMPEMTGLELHQHLTRNGIHIPTIIITAHADPLVRERSESAGVVTVLSKPWDRVALFSAIDSAIGSKTVA